MARESTTTNPALTVGAAAAMKRVFTIKDLRNFAAVTGDKNPIHIDAAYAESTIFGKPIVHGMLTASLFSTLLGTQLPGPGTVLVGQILKFLKPVYVGETVTAAVEIVSLRQGQGLVRLTTKAGTSRGLCVDGEAVVRVRRPFRG